MKKLLFALLLVPTLATAQLKDSVWRVEFMSLYQLYPKRIPAKLIYYNNLKSKGSEFEKCR
jgi:hypothetical protein